MANKNVLKWLVNYFGLRVRKGLFADVSSLCLFCYCPFCSLFEPAWLANQKEQMVIRDPEPAKKDNKSELKKIWYRSINVQIRTWLIDEAIIFDFYVIH